MDNTKFEFQKGKSTSIAMGEFTEKIIYSFEEEEKVLITFIDLTRASETVVYKIRMKALEKIGITNNLSGFRVI